MPDKMLQTIFLGDSSFQFVTAKTGWTKSQYRDMDTGNSSDIPLFTAAQEPVAFVEKQKPTTIEASEKEPILSFGANGDGSAGTNFVYHTRPFYVSNDRTCIRVIHKRILPLFIFYKLQNIKKIYGFDFHYKATPQNASLVSVEIPVDSSEQFDIDAQKLATDRFVKHEKSKQIIADHKYRISTALVSLETQFASTDESLENENLFELMIGKRILKKDVTKSGVPIYSANVRKSFGFTSNIIMSDFDVPSILWGIDGIFEWNLIPKDEQFTPTDHCGVLRVKHPLIYSPYVYHVLQATRERHGFDRTFRASLNNIKAISIPIPVRNKEFDLQAQIEIANRYQKIENSKNAAISVLDRILDTVVLQ